MPPSPPPRPGEPHESPGRGRRAGTTFGVPWPRGSLTGSQPLSLTISGEAVAVQSWPTGFWLDGSVKWTAHAVAPAEEFTREWLRYCRFYNATVAEQAAEFGRSFGSQNLRQAHSRLTAYVAFKTGDTALVARAWEEFYRGHAGYGPNVNWRTIRVEPPNVLKPID